VLLALAESEDHARARASASDMVAAISSDELQAAMRLIEMRKAVEDWALIQKALIELAE
jgi:hypothetical protein